ncbi:septate junction protein [Schistosoma mansoni]|uniref:septate junction protein n=1 Tax=Schistosoma mansoni TaxID=6183 RepID=UPI00022DC399|nr:septate junction protein [Schistosoma mansoni]|eukprot:XP_018652919.1 septate junction protein [Schistosoma mansoni]
MIYRYYWTLNGKHAYWIKPYNTTLSQELSYSTDSSFISKEGNTEYQLHSNDSHNLYTIDESGLWYFGIQKISSHLKTGLYQCIAINPFGKALSIPLKLEVAIMRFNSTNIPTAKVQWMIKDDEDGLINFVHEDRNHIIDDDGNLHLLNMNPFPHRNLTYTCVIHNLILHTMKTGPDIKLLFHSNALATTTTPPTPIKTMPELPKRIQILYHSPSNQIVLLNQSLSIKCIMYGYPLPKIHWEFMMDSTMNTEMKDDHQYKDVKLLPEKYGIKLKNHGLELYIPTVQMIHHGSYRCSGINLDYMIPIDDPYVIFNVTVESKPHFAEYPKNTILPENSSIVLRCSINEEITKPSATLNWLVNGEPVERYLNGLRKVIQNNVLYLYNLTVKDSAVFQCILHNRHGINIINAYIHVWNQPPAFIHVIHGIQYIIEGQEILLPCETFGSPQAEISWFFNEKQLNTFENLMKDDYIIEKNGNLHIISAKLSHNGTYLCKASNIFGISQSTGILFIRKQTRIISGPLIERNINTTTNTTNNTTTTTTHNNKRINMKYLIEGSNIQLACKVETDPLHRDQLTIVWKKDNLTLQDAFEHSDRLNITSSNNESLIIVNLLSSDTGIYMCIASTKLDNVNSSTHLIVQGKSLPSDIIPKLNSNHNELCIFPPKPIMSNTDYLIVYGNKPYNLIIQWKVTLQAENYLGSSGTKPLVFTGRSGEDIPQLTPIELKILHINSNNITLSWKMINDSDFSMKMNGIFQGFRIEWCNADLSNDSCEFYKKSQDYILEQPPSWSFPNLRRMSSQIFLDNQPINNNVVHTKGIPVPMSSTTIDSSNIQYENDYYIVNLNELPGKTKLKIWVRILNIQYAGPESDVIIVETKEGVPEKVSELTITFIGVNHIEVSWIKPMILNGELISYDLEIYLNNFINTTEIFSLQHSQLITSITIEDPEQCATHYGYIPFTITSIQDHVNSINLTLKTPFSLSNYDLNKSDLSNDSTDHSTTSFSWTSSSPTVFTTEQSTNTSNINNIEQIEKWNHPFMFYVQFRQLGTEIWEETQRELHNSWIVLKNLNKV